MRKPIVSIASLLLFVLSAAVVAKADVITNGAFAGTPNSTGTYVYVSDPANLGDYYHPTTITGWTFSDGSGIFKNGGFGAAFYPANPTSNPQFAFIQNAGVPNAISQTVTDTAAAYNLTFLLSGSNLDSVTDVVISINGVPVDTILATYGWKSYTIHFTGTGSDTISFSSDGVGTLAGLTDVSAIARTPEPSSIMLMGTGILGLAAAGRRKFFNA